MEKILSFIVNENKELLLLKGSPNDPQFRKSLWYVVTGGCETIDKTKEDTVKREINEETNLDTQKVIYLNWILKYKSLGRECVEYVYITFVKNTNIILNEESIGYKWCDIDDFIKLIDWFGDKVILRKVLDKAINGELFFNKEQVETFR